MRLLSKLDASGDKNPTYLTADRFPKDFQSTGLKHPFNPIPLDEVGSLAQANGLEVLQKSNFKRIDSRVGCPNEANLIARVLGHDLS